MFPEKIIEVTGLTKKFKEVTAVDNLTMNVYRGDVFGFLGPNGAGKSTTIRMLASLIFPNKGSINIFGKPLKSNRIEIMRRVGAIVEKPDFYKYLTAYKNLEILGRLSGCDVSKKRIYEVLSIVGLAERAKSKVKTYSHGMKQRLGIAQALLHEPELIILDEPTTGLDPHGMKDIRDLIVHLSQDLKKTILLSSHILHEVELVANRMIIISKGKTVVEGEVAELLNSTRLEVNITNDNPQKAMEIFTGEFPEVKIKSVNGQQISFYCNENDIPLINKALVDSEINVSAIVPNRSLEEYFLSLT